MSDLQRSQRIIIRVSGKVQGVFYRAAAKEMADRLGLTGIVRNEPDGSVYMEAEGTEEKIKAFSSWCKKGPPRSSVENFSSEVGPTQGYVGFRIVR
jgi:acylphosphatase